MSRPDASLPSSEDQVVDDLSPDDTDGDAAVGGGGRIGTMATGIVGPRELPTGSVGFSQLPSELRPKTRLQF